jgi:hypothetical protein
MGMVALSVATPARAEMFSDLSSLLFASFDASHRSAFASLGGKLLYPVGPETKGFVLASVGTSLSDVRKAREGKIPGDAVASHARLLLGVETSFDKVFASLAAGPSINAFQRKDGLGRTRPGVAAQLDIWYRPTSLDVVNATAIIDSGARSGWARLRYGRSFEPLPFLFGPEIAAASSVTTRKVQAGAHISEWALGRVTLSLSGGWVWERKTQGPYLSASAYMKY